MAQDDDLFELRVGRSGRNGGRAPRAPKLRAKLLEQVARRGGNPRRLGSSSSSPAPRSGRFNARGRGAKIAAAVPRGSGWSFDRGSGMRVRPRRVTVKARVVKLAGKAGAIATHMRYLERDGVSRDGEPGHFYTTFADEADAKAFMERGAGDRHQFRLIVAPEDGPAFDSLRGFTRDLMAKMEQDLGTNLDWVAVDHFDTGHPHSHILIRGVTEDGKTLNIAGDYIAHGIRYRASELMTRALGPQSELEVRQQLEHEVDAERLTRLDRAVLDQARDHVIDLRQIEGPMAGDASYQQLLVSRLRVLERMDLAEKAGPLSWTLSTDMEQTLSDMGRRGDIIRTMHKEMLAAKDQGADILKDINRPRRPDKDRYVVHGIDTPSSGPIIGKVIKRGAADDHHDRRYLIVDGIDGRSHYVDIGLEDTPTPMGGLVRLDPKEVQLRPADRTIVEVAAANGGRYDVDIHLHHDPNAMETYAQTHVRRLEAIRKATGKLDHEPNGTWRIAPDHLDTVLVYERQKQRERPVKIEMLSATPIEGQTRVQAVTWLDRELAATDRQALSSEGYGAEVRNALVRRQQWLIDEQLIERQGQDLLFNRNLLLKTLRDRDVRATAGQLSKELGIPFAEARPGETIEGTYKRTVTMASGKFALIEKSREFTLVPWRPEIERHIGKTMSGIMRGNDSISWTIGRERSGPSIGM